jgi:hypothetical protein
MPMKKCLLMVCVWLATMSLFAQDKARRKNDSDFFPIAVWAQDPVNALLYKENGINMYINIYGGLDQRKLDHLKKAGMKIIAHQNSFGLENLDEPLIYGWMHGDEPDNAQRNKSENRWDPCHDPSVVIGAYESMKKNDPGRPVYLNVGRGVAHIDWIGRGVCRGKTDMYKISNNGYLKGCDIASFDIYPVNASEEGVSGELWYVAKGIENLQEWSEHKKPTWCWIETTRISEKSKRKPTPDEVRSQVWMALIHGAKGFGYFCHSFVGKMDEAALLHDPEMITAVREINEQVASLTTVLNKPDTKGYAMVRTSNQSVPVTILTKRKRKANYIFAVAMRKGSTYATFEVASGKSVEVIGENRTLNIKKGKFRDEFSGYGVHLYKVTR